MRWLCWLHEFDDRFDRAAGTKTGDNAHLSALVLIGGRHDSANEHADASEVATAELVEDLGDERHVGAVEDADAEPVDVFVQGCLCDGFDSLPEATVDHMETGVAQAASNDLDA